MSSNSTEKFSVVYDGPAIHDGSIEMKDFARSLISLSELIEESASIIGHQKVSVRVQSVKKGSFEVMLSAGTTAVNLFSTQEAQSVLSILSAIGFVTGINSLPNLFSLIKQSMGTIPQKATEKKDGNINISFNHCNITVTPETFKLYNSLAVRQKLEDTLSILDSENIDELSFKNENDETIEKLTYQDAKYFVKPSEKEIPEILLNESIRETTVSLVNVALKDDNKWRLSTGGEKPFYATIKDEDFLDKVNKNIISFRKDDLFKVNLKTIQTRGAKGLNESYEVLKVIEHIEAITQLNLPIEKE